MQAWKKKAGVLRVIHITVLAYENGDLPWQNAWRVLNGDCSAWLQVKSTMKWRTLLVWAALSSSHSHVQEIVAATSSNESDALRETT